MDIDGGIAVGAAGRGHIAQGVVGVRLLPAVRVDAGDLPVLVSSNRRVPVRASRISDNRSAR